VANWLYFHIVSRFGKVVRTVYGGLSIRDLDLAYVRLTSHVCGFPKCSQKEMEKGIEVFDLYRVEPWDGGHGQENENENSGVVHRADAFFTPDSGSNAGVGVDGGRSRE
jgi:hypothetical protein